MMPDPRKIEGIEGPEANYPLVHTVADMLSGDDYERIRRTTADHIIALRAALGIGD